MGKIDFDKFICSWLKAREWMSDNECKFVKQALKDQGLYYHDGQIITEIQKKLLDMSTPRSQEAIEKAEKRKEERNRKSVFNRPTKQCCAFDKPQECELYPDCDDCSGNVDKDSDQGLQYKEEKIQAVSPKFKVGDTIYYGVRDTHFTITDISGGNYWYNSRIICPISEQEHWKLYEDDNTISVDYRPKEASKIVFSDEQEIELDLEHLKGTDMDGGVKGVMGSNAVVDDEDEQVYKKEFIEKVYDWLIERYENQGVILLEDINELKTTMEGKQ